METRSRKTSHTRQTTVRHLWLAGLGLVRMMQRKVSALGGQLLDPTGRKGKGRQSR